MPIDLDSISDEEYLALTNPPEKSQTGGGNPLYRQSMQQIRDTLPVSPDDLDSISDEEYLRATEPQNRHVGGVEYFEYLGNSFRSGFDVFPKTQAALGRATGQLDDAGYEQAIQAVEAQSVASAAVQTEKDLGGLVNPFTWPGVVLDQLPVSGASLLGGGAGALGGALVGGGIGLAGGPITGIGGLIGGAIIGNRVGAGSAAAMFEFGDAYDEYRKAGLSHDEAVVPALGTGVINGTLEMFEIGILQKVAKKAAKAAKGAGARIAKAREIADRLLQGENKEALGEMVKTLMQVTGQKLGSLGLTAATVGAQEGYIEAVQQAVQNAVLFIAAHAADKEIDTSKMRDAVWDSFFRGAIGGVGQRIGMHAVGATGGALVETGREAVTSVQGQIVQKKQKDSMQRLADMLKQAADEKMAELEEMDRADAEKLEMAATKAGVTLEEAISASKELGVEQQEKLQSKLRSVKKRALKAKIQEEIESLEEKRKQLKARVDAAKKPFEDNIRALEGEIQEKEDQNEQELDRRLKERQAKFDVEIPDVAAKPGGGVLSVKLSKNKMNAFRKELPSLPEDLLMDMVTNPNFNFEQAMLARQEFLRRKGLDLSGLREKIEQENPVQPLRDKLEALKQERDKQGTPEEALKREQDRAEYQLLQKEMGQLQEISRLLEQGDQISPKQIAMLKGKQKLSVQRRIFNPQAAKEDAQRQIQNIERKMADLEERIFVGEEDVDSLRDRGQELEERLEFFQNILDTGKLGNVDILDLPVEISQGKYRQLLREAESLLVQNTRKVIQGQKKITKQTLTALRQLIQKSGLPARLQGKYLSVFEKNFTPEKADQNLDALLAKIEADIEKAKHKDAMTYMGKVLKRTKIGLKGVTKFDTAARQKILDLYRAFYADQDLADKTVDTLAQKKAQMEAEDALNSLPEEEALTLEIASQMRGLKERSANHVLSLARSIDSFRAEGRQKRLEQEEQRKREIQNAATEILAVGRLWAPEEINSPAVRRELDSRLLKLGEKYQFSFGTWDFIWRTILQRSPNAGRIEQLLEGPLNMITSIANAYQAIRDTQELSAQIIADEAFDGNKAALNKYVQEGREKTIKLTYMDQTGAEVTLNLKRNEALQLLGWMRDEDARAGITKGNKFTFIDALDDETAVPAGMSTEQALRNAVGTQGLKVVDSVAKFYDAQFGEVSVAFEDEFKAPLGKVKNYFGPLSRAELSADASKAMADFFENLFETAALGPASIKARQQNVRPVVLTDMFSNMDRYIHSTRNWMHKRQAARMLRGILSSRELTDQIESTFGSDSLKVLRKFFNDFIRGDYVLYNTADKVGRALTGNFASIALSNPFQLLKQLTSISNVLLYVTPNELYDGITEFWSDPVSSYKYVNQHILIKMRAEIFDRDVAAISQDLRMRGMAIPVPGVFDGKPGLRRVPLRKIPTWLIGRGDKWAAAQSAFVIAKALERRGLSESEALRKGAEAANSIMGSATIDQMGDLARANFWTRVATIFTGPANQLFGHTFNIIRRAAQHPSFDSATKAVIGLAGIWLGEIMFNTIQPLLQASIPNLIPGPDDDDEREREVEHLISKGITSAIFGPAAGAAFFGPVIQTFATGVTNLAFDHKEKVWKIEFAPFEVISLTQELFQQAEKMVKKSEDWDDDEATIEWMKLAKVALHWMELVPLRNNPIAGWPIHKFIPVNEEQLDQVQSTVEDIGDSVDLDKLLGREDSFSDEDMSDSNTKN